MIKCRGHWLETKNTNRVGWIKVHPAVGNFSEKFRFITDHLETSAVGNHWRGRLLQLASHTKRLGRDRFKVQVTFE